MRQYGSRPDRDWETRAQDVYSATYRQYDATGSLLSTDTLVDISSGLRTGSAQTWSDVYTLQSQITRLMHWPVGPQNMDAVGITLDANLSYYTVTFNAQATDTLTNENAIWGEYTFNIKGPQCGYDGVRFAWKNQYGVWDYYNFSLAESRVANIERSSYNQSFVDYSSTTTTVPYNRERRGKNNYLNKIDKIRGANTDFLNDSDASNVRELFFSTDVYVQQSNGEWWPVVIETTNVVERTNPRSQKLFRFEIEYKYANGQRASGS